MRCNPLIALLIFTTARIQSENEILILRTELESSRLTCYTVLHSGFSVQRELITSYFNNLNFRLFQKKLAEFPLPNEDSGVHSSEVSKVFLIFPKVIAIHYRRSSSTTCQTA